MKPQEINPKTVQSNGIQKSTSFGIKSSGLHHILGILRNQLYSDKVLAVIREYTCNAVDAHTMACCPDRPIEVTFATRMQPTFKVRDYGTALTEQDIENVYAFYGESTKRNTNDQIGMLGIGSKSAFAYGDNFVINSFIDGKKHTYNAYIDPSQIGQISKLSEEDTDEENGIEIVVPVKEDDIEEFVTKGKKLFEWFNVRPIVKGTSQFEYKEDKVLFSGDGWKWIDCTLDRYDRNHSLTVVMGNIGYPVDTGDLNLSYEDKYRDLLTDNLVLEMPIGDLEISASREKLQFTDFTKNKLKETLVRVQKELSEAVSKEFNGADSLFAAKCLYGSVFRTDGGLYALKDIVKENLKWKGQVVDGSTFQTYNTTGVELRQFKKTYRSNKYRPDECHSIHCERGAIVIENDLGHRRGVMGRVLGPILEEGQTPFLLDFKSHYDEDAKKNVSSAAVKKQWLKDSKFDGELIKLSDLPQRKLSEFAGYAPASAGSSGDYSKDAKHSAKCFEFDFDFKGSSWHTKKSDFFKVAEVDVDNDSGVFVIIDKFQIEGINDYSMIDPKRISHLKDSFEAVKIPFPKKVHAFKVGQRSKIEGKDGWVSLNQWIKQTLEDVIEKNDLHQAWLNLQKVDALRNEPYEGERYYNFNCGNVIDALRKLKLADASGTCADFRLKYSDMVGSDLNRKKIEAINAIASDWNVEFSCPKGVTPTHDLNEALGAVKEKYSMLGLVGRSVFSYDFDNKSNETISNYINVIDLCNG